MDTVHLDGLRFRCPESTSVFTSPPLGGITIHYPPWKFPETWKRPVASGAAYLCIYIWIRCRQRHLLTRCVTFPSPRSLWPFSGPQFPEEKKSNSHAAQSEVGINRIWQRRIRCQVHQHERNKLQWPPEGVIEAESHEWTLGESNNKETIFSKIKKKKKRQRKITKI